MPINTQVIYKNGRYQLVPLVTLLAIVVDGRRLQTVGVEDVDLAVQEIDRLAESDGCFAHAGFGD